MGSISDKPLGLIAGGGALPMRVAQAHVTNGGTVFVIGLENEADPAISDFPHDWTLLGHLKGVADKLLSHGCADLVIIGGIQRPKLETLDFDEGGKWFVEQVMAGNHTGDNQLLKTIIAYFQMRGLTIQPPQKYLGALLGQSGSQTSIDYTSHQDDITRAIEVAQVIGAADIGQSIAVAHKLVLAVEGPEGTDAMLARLQTLSPEFRGSADAPRGVLAKLPKPQQDRRVDLPTLGQKTVELAAAAHLAGIVYEAGGALFDDFEAVVALAEEKKMFLLGLEGAQL